VAQYDEVISALPYFGNIEFYAHNLQQDMLVDIHEHYVKQSLRNRCELVASQGQFHLTVPVHRPSGTKTAYKDIRISYDEDWRHEHRHAVRSAYGSSPFYIHYWDEISAIWDEEFELLQDLSLHAHTVMADLIGFEPLIRTSEFYIHSTPGKDLRPRFKKSDFKNEKYIQVFADRLEFVQNLSTLDLLFCKGPESLDYLEQQKLT
jgi:hypothetical protein